MVEKRAPIIYGVIGCCAYVGTGFGYSIGSDIAPGPYGRIETGVLDPVAKMWNYVLMALIGLLFFGLYSVVLTLMQKACKRASCAPWWLFAMGCTAIAAQLPASVATIIFLRNDVGWNLHQNISVPIDIAGNTVPGLLGASIMLILCGRGTASQKKWRRWWGTYRCGSKRIKYWTEELIEYIDGDKRTMIHSERSSVGTIVWPSRTKQWLTPTGDIAVNRRDIETILLDLKEALRVPIIVQDGP